MALRARARSSAKSKQAAVALHGGGDLSRISWQSKQLKVEWQVRTLAARTVTILTADL
jgi:hypothetical protein